MNRPEGFPRNHADLPPVEAARMLACFVDELIPGSDAWPSASSAGVHGLIAMRLSDAYGQGELASVLDAILAAGGPFDGRTAEERRAIVAAIEATRPALFERVYAATVLAYYESPFVTAAIRRLRRPYENRPHVAGYAMRPFDPATDSPKHGRGAFTPTAAVRPVDVSALKLDQKRTERWGIGR